MTGLKLVGYPNRKDSSTSLVYECAAQYDAWLKLLLGSILLLTFGLGIFFLSVDIDGALVTLGATVFDALLFYGILPRRYQIFQDRLRIVFGRPFVFNIALTTIREVRSVPGLKAFAYSGIRFATSTRSVMEVVRSKGWNVVISPVNRELFLEQLDQAIGEISNISK